MIKPFYFLLTISFFNLSLFSQTTKTEEAHLFPIKQNGKYGYIDKTGKVIIKPMYIQTFPADFSEGLLPVEVQGKYGFINEKGDIVIQPTFERAEFFNEGLAAVKTNGKYGYINTLGKIVIEAQYDQAYGFSEGIAVVEIPEKVAPVEDDPLAFLNDPKPKESEYDFEHTYRFIDKQGNFVFPLQLYQAQVHGFCDGMACVHDRVNQEVNNSKSGFIDKTGIMVIPLQYNYASNFKDGLAVVRTQTMGFDEEFFIDKTGKRFFGEKTYSGARNFSEGLAAVKVDQKWGFIDKTGKMIIEPKYDDIGDFSEGLVQVELNKKWGYIDKTGKIIIPFKFTKSGFITFSGEGDFQFGLARVKLGSDKTGYIDKTGKFIWKPTE